MVTFIDTIQHIETLGLMLDGKDKAYIWRTERGRVKKSGELLETHDGTGG